MSSMFDKMATSVATRRGSLALGSAALLGLAQAPRAGAKKKCSKRIKKKVDRTCGRQVDECTTYVAQNCATFPDPAVCEAAFTPCCEFLGDCDFTGFGTCTNTAAQQFAR